MISACVESGVAKSTVDGFHARADGYAEDVDLMFTFVADCGPVDTASAVAEFIKDKDGPDLAWEVWSAGMEAPPKGASTDGKLTFEMAAESCH